MKPLLDSNLPQGPAYVFSKLNEIPTLLLTENIGGMIFRHVLLRGLFMNQRTNLRHEHWSKSNKSVPQAAMHFNSPHVHSPHFSDVYCNEEPRAITVEQFLRHAQEPSPYGQTTYRSCASCSKGMPNPESDHHGCPSTRCNNTSGKTTQRYKIRLEAIDHASRLYLTLFDKPAQDLLQISATKLEHIKSKHDGLSKIQALFNKVANRTCNFYIRYDDDAFRHGRKGSGNYTANSINWFPRAFTPLQPLPLGILSSTGNDDQSTTGSGSSTTADGSSNSI